MNSNGPNEPIIKAGVEVSHEDSVAYTPEKHEAGQLEYTVDKHSSPHDQDDSDHSN